MPNHVCNNAVLKCSFGQLPSKMTVLPVHRMMTGGQPAANIMDAAPMVNIMPFGLCSAPTNPVVIAATAAKAGAFTPAPCTPATTPPWVPSGTTVILDGTPALDSTAKLVCKWLGVITVNFPGEVTEQIP